MHWLKATALNPFSPKNCDPVIRFGILQVIYFSKMLINPFLTLYPDSGLLSRLMYSYLFSHFYLQQRACSFCFLSSLDKAKLLWTSFRFYAWILPQACDLSLGKRHIQLQHSATLPQSVTDPCNKRTPQTWSWELWSPFSLFWVMLFFETGFGLFLYQFCRAKMNACSHSFSAYSLIYYLPNIILVSGLIRLYFQWTDFIHCWFI